MKKILCLILCLFALCACTSKTENQYRSLEDIKESGYITIATEGTWQPWTYHDESDTLVGYDIEVGKYIAEYLGVEAKFIEGEWDGLLAGIEAGRYDLMINGVNVTDERSKIYDFSNAYAYDRVAIIVLGDSDIESFEDLNGKKTANTISSIYAEMAESYGASVTGVDDLNQTFLLLERGDIDATLNAEMTYYDYMKAHPEKDFRIAALSAKADEIAIPMHKDNEELLVKVNEALDAMKEDGTLTELSVKYFGVDISEE